MSSAQPFITGVYGPLNYAKLAQGASVSALSKLVPGVASATAMGSYEGSDRDLAAIGAQNARIARQDPDAAGATRELGFQPVSNFKTPGEAIIANSDVLCLADLDRIRAGTAPTEGGKLYVGLQRALTSLGEERGIHAECRFAPEDGNPWGSYTGIDTFARPLTKEGDEMVSEIYAARKLSKALRTPASPFEKLYADPRNSKLGQPNVVDAYWAGKNPYSFNRVISASVGDPEKVIYETFAVLEHDLTADEMTEATIVRELIMLSHERGKVASLGIHVSANSCGVWAWHLRRPGQRPLPMDQALYALIDDASAVYSTDARHLRFSGLFDAETGELLVDTLKKSEKEVMKEDLANKYAKKAMSTTINADRLSHACQYNGTATVPADADADAEGFFRAVNQVVISHLEGISG
ncbi:hypothetical protein BC361_20945 [Ensifer sp. LC54]|nr:hypothetical protein BC363_24465 [Ensifer sp. LC384]OCP24275.1 hypothetical protein BC361_20945 [Ensifer sp. LC54]